MQIIQLKEGLPLFKALDSDIRCRIMEILSEHVSLNIQDIATEMNLTSAAMTMHIKKLEECGLISTKTSNGKHGTQKICSLNADKIIIEIQKDAKLENEYDIELNVGHYTNYQAFPTCGLATQSGFVGEVDDPRYFDDPERINAGILWFTKGFVEYRVPNYLKPGQVPSEIQISFELGSEAPGYCENWPSDIYFYFNDIKLGYWISPGDFGEKRGIFNPFWWPNWNQHGVFKLLSINQGGSFIDGHRISKVAIDDLALTYKSELSLKLAVPDEANNIGGLTIFGKGFGNYNQGIRVRVIYETKNNTGVNDALKGNLS